MSRELDQALQRLYAVAHSHGELGAQPSDLLLVVGALQPLVADMFQKEPETTYWVRVFGPRLVTGGPFPGRQGNEWTVSRPSDVVEEDDGRLWLTTAPREIMAGPRFPENRQGTGRFRPATTVQYGIGEWTHYQIGAVVRRDS